MRGKVKMMKTIDSRVSAAPNISNTPPLLGPPSTSNGSNKMVLEGGIIAVMLLP